MLRAAKSLFVVAALLLVPTLALPVRADTAEGASSFIRDLGAQAIAVLSDKQLGEQAREAAMRHIFLTGFDVDGIARFALGRYWRSASEAEQKQYLDLFKDYVVKVYTKALSQAQNTRFVVKSARPSGTLHDVLVLSEVGEPDQDPIQVHWRVRETGRSFKVEDVVVEGVSMLLTKRHDFGAVLSQNDGKIDVLLERLQQEIDKIE